MFVDTARQRLVMWYHGLWTNGNRWPSDPAARQGTWPAAKFTSRYGQFTQVAESTDGIHFEARPSITKTAYLRVFRYGGYFYGVSRLGELSRAVDPLASFEIGQNPFRDGPYADRVRHVALVLRKNRLHIFFTAIGDAPERVLMSTIDLTQDWAAWRAMPPVEVLQPETDYECAGLPNTPSEAGDVNVRVRQLRDPFVIARSEINCYCSIQFVASRASPRPR